MELMSSELYRTLSRRYNGMEGEDIQDALSASTLVVLERSAHLEPIENVDAFMTVVAKRELSKQHKRRMPLVFPDASNLLTWEKIETQTSTCEEIENTENRSDVGRVLDSMPPAYAEVLRMHYLEGMTLQGIADVLQINPCCVRKRHERALRCAKKVFSNNSCIAGIPPKRKKRSKKKKEQRNEQA
jgi:RNA polymerase sigma factor (sigma-70 family)